MVLTVAYLPIGPLVQQCSPNAVGGDPPINTDFRAITIKQNPKRYAGICASVILRKSNVEPRPRAVTPGNQDDVLHVIKAKPEVLSEGEPAFDMFKYPFSEISPCNSVLAPRLYRKE